MKQSIVDQKHLDGPDRASCSKSTVLVNQLAAGDEGGLANSQGNKYEIVAFSVRDWHQ